jgi:flagellar basal-body rod protein FlgF
MDTTSYLALSRQVALQRHLTTVATNLANTGTTAYRAEHTLFESVLQPPSSRTSHPEASLPIEMFGGLGYTSPHETT